MRRKNNIFLILFLLIVSIMFKLTRVEAKNTFQEGNGTQTNPYIISNTTDLMNLNNFCGSNYQGIYYKLNNDIDLKDIDFEPICSEFNNSFKGNLDGNNHKIININIDKPNQDFVGLFGRLGPATIKDLTLEGTTIIGKNGVGSLAGFTGENSTLENIKSNINIVAQEEGAGGITGYLSNQSQIINSINYKSVSGKNYVGGLVGKSSKTYYNNTGNNTITNSHNEGNITGDNYIGGIAGSLTTNSKIEKTFNLGNVIGTNNVGGIVGSINITDVDSTNTRSNSMVKECYNKGTISGIENVGGISGNIINSSNIIDTYNDGKIKAQNNFGGIVGYIKNDTNNDIGNFISTSFDTSTEVLVGNIDDANRNTFEYTYYKNNFSNIDYKLSNVGNIKNFAKQELFEGFDFDNVWQMGNSHPELKNVEDKEAILEKEYDMYIYYNDVFLDIDNYSKVVNDDNGTRTMVNINKICEYIGCNITSEDNNNITIELSEELVNNKTAKYIINHEKKSKNFNSTLIIGNEEYLLTQDKIDVASEIKNGELYMPIRFVAQALGKRVTYDGNNRVDIYSNIGDVFNDYYDIVLSKEEKRINEKLDSYVIPNNNEYILEKNETYNLYVISKSDKTVQDMNKAFVNLDLDESKALSDGKFEKTYGNTEIITDKRQIKVIGNSGDTSNFALIALINSNLDSVNGKFTINKIVKFIIE